MKRSKFDENRDQAAAESFPKGFTPELMCSAHGCPNRWTVDGGGAHSRCCSAHAWASAHDWPLITQQQQWDETDRARSNGEPKLAPVPMSIEEKREIVASMQPAIEKLRAKAIA